MKVDGTWGTVLALPMRVSEQIMAVAVVLVACCLVSKCRLSQFSTSNVRLSLTCRACYLKMLELIALVLALRFACDGASGGVQKSRSLEEKIA